MGKSVSRSKWSQEIWVPILSCLALFSVVFCFRYSTFVGADRLVGDRNKTTGSCSGKYIYVHHLPPRFNADLLANCRLLTRGTDDSMCPYIQNGGFGVRIDEGNDTAAPAAWFDTNQFMLEVIFHSRMMRYRCLTEDYSVASAVFVPFYAGLDVSLRLWNPNVTERDASARDVTRWLSAHPAWGRMRGRDHFVVGGRISWDFRRRSDDGADWGSKLRFLPESENMSMLSVEASSWRNDHAVPYPTNFHPPDLSSVLLRQRAIRVSVRTNLFTFAGAPRPEMADSIRGRVIRQCRASARCELIDCGNSSRCRDPLGVTKAFESSVYCLQPPGDSYTRRSIFDSILAGCIPVFFHPGTAYSQYLWHLPRNYTRYSVYIPVEYVRDLKDGDIEKALLRISKEREEQLREEVIGLIPRIVYAGPDAGFEDAFDLAVRGFLERVEQLREAIREGKDPGFGFSDEDNYKFTFSDWDKRQNQGKE